MELEENETGMISFRKNTSEIHTNIGQIKENAKVRASLPDIKVQLDTVDSNPSNIGEPQNNANDTVTMKEEIDCFNFTYFGSTDIDKRTLPSVFPWIAKRIIKHSMNQKDVFANISKSQLWLAERNDSEIIIQKHSFDSIYRLSRMTKSYMEDFLAYIICSKADGSNAVFHLLKSNNQQEVWLCFFSFILFIAKNS